MPTLKQIAHFDRCLFPEDFKEQLLKKGIAPRTACYIADHIHHNRKGGKSVGIVNLYQDFTGWDELTNAFEAILDDFCKD